MDIDPDKCTLTVVGTVDPVRIVHKLKKACFAAAIVSVEDDKPKKKDPCQEACEKACKEACEKGRYYCMPGCSYYNPCALPNCNYKSARTPVRYGCYEERSPGGECTIQ